MDDRDTLANLIDPNALELDTHPWPRDAADRVLASDWLAARDARVKAEALEEAADASRTENGEGDLLTSSWLRARAAEHRKHTN